MKPNQTRLWETEDLPLFSNTPINTTAPARPSNTPVPIQVHLPYNCAACCDTGRLDDGFCWCTAGDETRTHRDDYLTYLDMENDELI